MYPQTYPERAAYSVQLAGKVEQSPVPTKPPNP